jgi:uncharacterized protein (DUF433 family)
MKAMATAARTVQIVKTPGVRGGKARIDGTRICVVDVVRLHERGASPEEIRAELHGLTLAQVQAAIDYGTSHRDEIEASKAAETKAALDDERRWEEMLARHGGHPPTNPTLEERTIPRPFHWTPKK